MNILLAVDGSACSELAVHVVIERFRPAGVHVRVLHAVQWLAEMPLSFEFGEGPTYARGIEDARRSSFTRAGDLVARVEGELKQAGFQTSVSTPDADPRHAIVESARDWPADFIVMGSHGRRGMNRFLMGSIAEAVMHHARCSVLIVRVPSVREGADHEAA